MLQLVLDAFEGLFGQFQLAHLQIDHGMQRRLVLLLVVALQGCGRGAGKAAQSGQPGNVVAIAVAQVLLVSDPAHDLARLDSAQLGQAVEHVDAVFHGCMPRSLKRFLLLWERACSR